MTSIIHQILPAVLPVLHNITPFIFSPTSDEIGEQIEHVILCRYWFRPVMSLGSNWSIMETSQPEQLSPSVKPVFPPPMSNRSLGKLLVLLKPYTIPLGSLVLIAVVLSFLNGLTQVALTPLLNIVLGQETGAPASAEGSASSGMLDFDLNNLGAEVLVRLSDWTGLTDRWHLLVVATLVFLALNLIGQGTAYGARYWMTSVRFRITADLEHHLFDHILRLPLTFLDRFQAGWLFSRMDNDVRIGSSLMADLIIDGLSNLLVSFFYAFLLLKTSLSLTIFAAIAGVVQIGVSRVMSGYTKHMIRSAHESIARLQGYSLERLSAVREVKALAGEAYEAERFGDRIAELMLYLARHSNFKRLEQPIRFIVNRIALVAVMLYGARQMLNGRISTTAFLLFMFFAQSLVGPLSKLAELLLSAVEIRATLDGAGYLLNQVPESTGGGKIPAPLQNEIVLRDVSFAYEGLPVLRHINLRIKQGQMIALIGRSGAGKTTLVDLLMRFYEPAEGSIEFDGAPIQDFELASFRRLFGVVSQDGLLFNDTVYNNIAYARPDLTQEDVVRAARIANAEDFILNDLRDGYDTLLGERGVRLSGGQRQRIAIARAVAHRPSILILDEATSALDTVSERQVQGAIEQVVKDSTAVVIAHRLSTILMADQIVVLRDGEIVEMGTHQELIALGGEYKYLYDLQFVDIPQAVAE